MLQGSVLLRLGIPLLLLLAATPSQGPFPQPSPSPGPREAFGSASSGADASNGERQGEHETPRRDTPALADQPETGKTRRESEGVTDGDEHRAEHRVRLAPVDIRKDWTDHAYWFFSLALVVVAFIQSGLLWKTMRATKQAADAATKSADVAEAALHQVEAAYLDIIRIWQPLDYRIAIKLRNLGRSPAFVQAALIRGEKFAAFPESPDFGLHADISIVPFTLPPSRSVELGPVEIQIPDSPPDEERDLFDFADGSITDEMHIVRFTKQPYPFCIAYGFIVYKDAFGRSFRLGFGFQREGRRYTPIRSEKYNYLTCIDGGRAKKGP